MASRAAHQPKRPSPSQAPASPPTRPGPRSAAASASSRASCSAATFARYNATAQAGSASAAAQAPPRQTTLFRELPCAPQLPSRPRRPRRTAAVGGRSHEVADLSVDPLEFIPLTGLLGVARSLFPVPLRREAARETRKELRAHQPRAQRVQNHSFDRRALDRASVAAD